MSYHHTLEAVLESIHEIEALVIGFTRNEKLSAIEIDLALQKLRSLYELMLMLKNEDKSAIENPVIIEDKRTELKTEKEYSVIKQDKKVETAVPFDNNVELEDVKVSLKKKETIETHVKTIADKFTGHKTLHESLNKSNSKENNYIAQSKPLKDLYSAIGINDRFTFIKELFNNDKTIFENTIESLNNVSSFNDAYNYIIRNFEWDMDSDPVQLLLEIIRRKFIKNRDV